MNLLQAVISEKMAFAFIAGLFLLIGIPMLVSILMKFYWKTFGKKDGVKTGKTYYTDIIPFISIIALSVFVLLLLLYLLTILFDISFPVFE